MSDVKQLIDEYANEATLLRARVQELQTALIMAISGHGEQMKDGSLVLRVPAKARKVAGRIERLGLDWSNDEWATKGSLRLKATMVKDNENDDT